MVSEFPLTPMEDRVAVLPDVPEEKIGNIILPDSAKRVPCRGRIVAVGEGKVSPDGKTIIPPNVEVGMVIWYEKYQGQQLELIDGKEKTTYLFLRPSDLIAIER